MKGGAADGGGGPALPTESCERRSSTAVMTERSKKIQQVQELDPGLFSFLSNLGWK